MSEKNLDRNGRWRNITVAFRVSPEENERINAAVRISGLTKQEYITRRLEDMEVVVQGNPKVFWGLREELRAVAEQLRRLESVSDMDTELFAELKMISFVMEGMKEEDAMAECYNICLDVGGTKVLGAIFNEKDEIIYRLKKRSKSGGEGAADVEQVIVDVVEEMIPHQPLIL